MKRQVGRRRRGTRKPFLLAQILKMKPYVMALMRDLRDLHIRQDRLKRNQPEDTGMDQSYQERKRRHEANAERAELEQQELSLKREFAQLGVRVGNIVRGEMLFPCLVDNKEAYFVWFDDEAKPTQWRFRGESDSKPIPEHWFSLFATAERS